MLNDEKIRAARGFLDWTQDDLARRTGISKSSIANIEAGRVEPETRTLRRIEEAFGDSGVFFTANGVEKREFVLTTHKDYMAVLDDVERTIPPGEEILFHCADDRRSSPAVAEKLAAMRAAGYRFRSTICAGNTTITGDLADYRWIPEDYFANSEICVIYGDKYMQHVPGETEHNFIIMKSAIHATSMRRQFEYWWSKGEQVGARDVRN